MKSLIVLLPLFFLPFVINAQGDSVGCSAFGTSAEPYSNCTAIFYKGKMLVDDYSPDGKCRLEEGMSGRIVISTVSLSDFGAKQTGNVGFKVAIRNTKTNTIWSYSDQVLYEINLEDILKKCEAGDNIIFITTNKQHALPHNEIEVAWGC